MEAIPSRTLVQVNEDKIEIDFPLYAPRRQSLVFNKSTPARFSACYEIAEHEKNFSISEGSISLFKKQTGGLIIICIENT